MKIKDGLLNSEETKTYRKGQCLEHQWSDYGWVMVKHVKIQEHLDDVQWCFTERKGPMLPRKGFLFERYTRIYVYVPKRGPWRAHAWPGPEHMFNCLEPLEFRMLHSATNCLPPSFPLAQVAHREDAGDDSKVNSSQFHSHAWHSITYLALAKELVKNLIQSTNPNAHQI